MLTPEELRAIVRRHEADDMLVMNPLIARRHADRGALLDLLRRVAEADWICTCNTPPDPHRPDCPAPVLEALRQPAPSRSTAEKP